MFLKQSTAYTFRFGPFLDDTDGKTAETGLTISQADIRLSKGGGNFAQKNESSSSSHDEIGFYIVVLDATDTNTCGELLVACHESGALPVFKTFQVLEEAIYDAMFAASASAFDANARVDVASIEGSDATDQINAACDAALSDYDAPTKAELDSAFTEIKGGSWSSSTDTLEAIRDRGDAEWVTASAPAASAIADAVWDEATSGHTSSGSYGKAVSDILTDTAEIGSAGAGLTAVPWNSSWDTEVQSECNDALVALGLDHLVSASVAGSDVVDNSIIAKLVSKESTADWDDYVNTTDSLEAIRDRGDAAWTTGGGGSAPTAAAVADAVWDEAASGHTSSGTFGKYLADVLTDTAEIGSAGAGLTGVPWNSSWDSEVQSECNDALVALGLDHLISASVAGSDVADDSIVAKLVSKESTADWDDFVNTTDSLQAIRDRGDSAWITASVVAASAIADAVWDEATSGHTSSGTYGKAVGDGVTGWATATGFNTTTPPTAAAISDAVWDEAASGHASSGTFGKYVADILTDTAVIGANGAGLSAVPWNSAWDSEVQSEVADGLAAYDPPTKAEMDAMWTTAQTESYASDGAAATPAQLLYMILCSVSEFAISGTTITGKKVDGSTTAMTWTINDASNPTSRTRAS